MQELLDFTNPATVAITVLVVWALAIPTLLTIIHFVDKKMCRSEDKRLKMVAPKPSDEPQSLALNPTVLGVTA